MVELACIAFNGKTGGEIVSAVLSKASSTGDGPLLAHQDVANRRGDCVLRLRGVDDVSMGNAMDKAKIGLALALRLLHRQFFLAGLQHLCGAMQKDNEIGFGHRLPNQFQGPARAAIAVTDRIDEDVDEVPIIEDEGVPRLGPAERGV